MKTQAILKNESGKQIFIDEQAFYTTIRGYNMPTRNGYQAEGSCEDGWRYTLFWESKDEQGIYDNEDDPCFLNTPEILEIY